MRQNKYEYDAFISHAVEDKIPIANELCAKLERAGLRIWYSGKELGVGDSIEKTIERGLNRSRFGIVIFSPTYLAKNWTIREFYTLLAKEIEEQKVILPVLYNISLDDLKNKDLVMADRFAVNSDKGIDFVVERLVREIRKDQVVERKEAWFSKIWFVLILSLLANFGFLVNGTIFSTPRPEVIPAFSPAGSEFPGQSTLHRTLLGEMENMFKKISGCSCNYQDDMGKNAYYDAGFAQNHEEKVQTDEAFGEPNQRRVRSKSALQGKKMTMAVVFQIETPPQFSPDPDQEVKEIFSTIGLREKQDPFVQVTSLNTPKDR